MILIITTETDTLFFDEIIQLEGLEYLFRFIWVDRESSWLLNIYDTNENPLALGIRLVVSWPLLRRFRDPRLPPGVLLCVDQTGNQNDVVAPTDLGNRVLLTYITSDDPLLA